MQKYLESLKELGLKNAEQSMKDLVSDIIKPMAQEYILESENKIDDVLLPFIGQVEQAVLELADKIHEPKAEEPETEAE